MSNEEMIKNMNTDELAEFIHDVSCNCAEITTCKENCADCFKSDCDCISSVKEWLKKDNCKPCMHYYKAFDAPEGTEDCHWEPSEDEEERPCEKAGGKDDN